jgi:hypothetical protein
MINLATLPPISRFEFFSAFGKEITWSTASWEEGERLVALLISLVGNLKVFKKESGYRFRKLYSTIPEQKILGSHPRQGVRF